MCVRFQLPRTCVPHGVHFATMPAASELGDFPAVATVSAWEERKIWCAILGSNQWPLPCESSFVLFRTLIDSHNPMIVWKSAVI